MKDIERRFINPQQGALDTVLPDAVEYFASGRDVFVANIDTVNIVVVKAMAGQTVNGILAVTVIPGNSGLFMSDGSGWRTLGLTPVDAARVGRLNLQPVLDTTLTAIPFETVTIDTVGMFSSALPTRLTIKSAGNYQMGATVEFAAAAAGVRLLGVRANGATFFAIQDMVSAGAGSTSVMAISTMSALAVGDYLEMMVLQTSGGTINVTAVGAYSPKLWAHRSS